MGYIGLSLVALAVILCAKLWKVFNILIWRPYVLSKYLAKQGLRGPGYSVLTGSLREMDKLKGLAAEKIMDPHDHNIIPRALPHYHKWLLTYGENFVYWFGTDPRILISDPEHAKEILSTKFAFYTKPKARPAVLDILGDGLLMFSDRIVWERHRKVVNPAFHADKIKAMTKTMAACTLSSIDRWKELVVKSDDQCKEVEMALEFQDLAADVIVHTAFGSSYAQGKQVFDTQRELLKIAPAYFRANFFPGTEYLPTRLNRHIWKLTKKVRTNLKGIVESRLSSKGEDGSSCSSYGEDLLGLMITASETGRKEGGSKLNMDEIIEECMTFFFAGHESTAHLLTWSMFFLGLEKQWQENLREEVLRECGTEIPDADQLNKLKLVNMVLLEALRLYSPALYMIRTPTEDIRLGNWTIPKDTHISIPLAIIHRNKKYWGDDAGEFNPQRFADGISNAVKHPNALLAFAAGPRVCIGQNFAMLEAKMVLVLILQRFSFSLSPNYKHAPIEHIVLQTQFGLPILLRNLHV